MNDTEKRLAKVQERHGFKPFYRLRYRFDFAGRPSVVGYWNRPEPDLKKQVWTMKKDGLVRVAIEGERQHFWTVHTLLEVDGHDYASMRWVNVVPLGGWSHGTFKREGEVCGITILTASKAATVFVDGTGDLRDLNEYELKFKLREHSI